MNKLKKIAENISIIIIVAVILLSALLIGSPLDTNNILVVYIICGVFSIAYYILLKEKIIQDRIDIWVSILSCSTLIPLILNTYVSLSGTIYSIIKYTCILNMFLITKNECRRNSKYKKIILNTVIISILILCLFGLDEIGGNYLKSIKQFIGYRDIGLKEGRIGSLFSYANAIAAIAGAGVFLCMGYVLTSKDIKIKLLYIMASIIMFITMILTYSRLIFIVFSLISIIYILILCKKYNIITKINKKIIYIFITMIILIIAYIVIGLKISAPLDVQEKFQKKIYNIQSQAKYKFEFDINATCDLKDNFNIKIVEKNEYLDTIKTTKIKLDNFTGKKQIDIETKKDTTAIYVIFERQEEQGKLIINKMTMNNEQIILKYKLLPTNLVFKIQEIDLTQKSAWQRFVYIGDAFKIIKENWIFGFGGDSWSKMLFKVQDYSYYAKETHSYPAQIFVENGILAFVSYIAVIICIIRVFFNEIKKQEMDFIKISVIIGMGVILLHSIFDTDMSYFYILLIVFIMMAILDNSKRKENKINVIQKIVLVVFILMSIATLAISSMEKYYYDHETIIIINDDKTVADILKIYHKLMPYNFNVKDRLCEELLSNDNEQAINIIENIIKTEKYDNLNLNVERISKYVEAVIKVDKNIDDKLGFAFKYVCDTEDFSKYRAELQLDRWFNLNQIIEQLYISNNIEYAEKFNEQLIKEIKEKEKCILDYKKGRYNKNKVELYTQKILEIKNYKYKLK